MSGLIKKMRPVDDVEAEVSCITVLQVLEIKRVIKEWFFCAFKNSFRSKILTYFKTQFKDHNHIPGMC